MYDKISVMVTGIGGGGHGAQILKALRLSSLSLEIIGTDTSDYSTGFAGVDTAYVVPPASDPDYIPRILELCQRHSVRALFHGSEPELKAMSQNRELFHEHGILLPVNDKGVIERCMDKDLTMQFLSEHGYCFPKSWSIRSMGDLEAIDTYPLVLKPSIGSGGSANVFIAQDGTELRCLSEYMLRNHDRFQVQEYVGSPEQEYTVGVLHSLDGELMGSIALRRSLNFALSRLCQVTNRTSNKSLGPKLAISSGVSQGMLGGFTDVTQFCEKIASKIGSKGPLNIQCRLAKGKVYIFEINPRFSGTTSLRAMAGFNEPEMLMRKHLLREPIAPITSIPDMFVARGLQEVVIDPDIAKNASM